MPAKKTSIIGGLYAKVRAPFSALAPVGYQDETGFHVGPNRTDAENRPAESPLKHGARAPDTRRRLF
jgi:hypothetical protein